MKKIKELLLRFGMIAAVMGISSCTDLTETVYDQVTTQNYYNTRSDVIHAVFRPFEHVYYCMWQVHEHEELPADQLVCVVRGDWWYDNAKWIRYHRHQYDDITLNEPDNGEWMTEWTQMYTGIGQCNLVLDDLKFLNPDDFNITSDEWASFEGQLRCMRAFCYLRLINCYRKCIITTTSETSVNNSPEVLTPKSAEEVFSFIESELLDCLSILPSKTSTGGNGDLQGQFTKAAAASLLVRLYLNAEVWIGQSKYAECMAMCDRIINGEFGPYLVASRWDEAFDWNNETSDEVIFAFSGSFATSNWHLNNSRPTVYGRGLPYGCERYLNIEKDGTRNPRYCISPSYDNDGNLFDYQLGMVSQKFLKYAQISPDKRWKQYKNLSDNTREGMFFLEGKIADDRNTDNGGWAKSPQGYTIYLRDQVGLFLGSAEQGVIPGTDKSSKCENGDFNSGFFVMKYPFYPYDGGYYKESDFTQIRLPEIIYSKAECLLRNGDAMGAGTLLNSVRKRNYENFTSSIAYQPEGNVILDENEMLDEWGREFLAESRRRTDLIRFGRFQDAWWDKGRDADTHYELFPLSQYQLETNSYLSQIEGYADINR